jgi:hypothetical protein
MMGAANTSTVSETIYQYVDIIYKRRIHKILLFSLRNLKVRYCVHKSSPFVPSANKINPVCALLSYLCKIYSRASKLSLSFRPLHQDPVCIQYLCLPYMPHALPIQPIPCRLIKIQTHVMQKTPEQQEQVQNIIWYAPFSNFVSIMNNFTGSCYNLY